MWAAELRSTPDNAYGGNSDADNHTVMLKMVQLKSAPSKNRRIDGRNSPIFENKMIVIVKNTAIIRRPDRTNCFSQELQMMNRSIIAAVSLATFAAVTAANGATIAAWNYNNNLTVPELMAVTTDNAVGTPTMTSQFAGNSFGGSVIGAVAGDAAGQAYSPQQNVGGATGGANQNGFSMTYSINLTGYTAPTLTYASQRTSTGFTTQQWAYSTDGGANFTNLGSGVTGLPTAFALQTVDFSGITLLANNPLAQFRMTLTGATAAAGNNRIDNTVFSGNVFVPPNVAPIVVDPAPQAVVFGSVVSNGAPFSATIGATDINLADILSLAVTPTAGISNIVITGGGTSPTNFTVTGTVDYSLNGTTVLVPYTVSDGAGGSTGGNITLVITPEPATLGALAGVGTLLLRRRK
jgi:hypothetical protein